MIKVNRVDIDIADYSGKEIKVAVISDIHAGLFLRRGMVEKVSRIVNEEAHDFTVMPGDFCFDIKSSQIHEVLAPLADISGDKYAVFGNHDNGDSEPDEREALTRFFESADIQLIENTRVEAEYPIGNKISIAGHSDFWLGDLNFDMFKSSSSSVLTIAVSHNPDIAYQLADARPDILVSGHTHGGQVRIPFIYKLFIPTMYDFDQGRYRVFDTEVWVSSGIGMVWLPFRFLMPPSIDIITLH